MTYKIVRTIERGKTQLCIVPSQWENGGLLQWPKKGAEKLVMDENSSPRPDWTKIICTVKRYNLVSYEAAEIELRIMLENTDTEHEEELNIRRPGTSRQVVNLNELAEHLVLSQNSCEIDINPSQANVSSGTPDTYIIVPNNTDTQVPEPTPDIQNMLLQNQATLIEITTNLLANQKKIMHKLASLSVQIEESASKIDNYLYSAEVTTLKDASQAEKHSFTIKQISTAADLEGLEERLTDGKYKETLKKSLSIICSGGKGSGINCAYRLVDVLFCRKFLCECSWSGSTRKDGVKISFKCCKNILSFFFKVIHQWDDTYTQEINESFFKNILKNANKRKIAKNIRIPAKRLRTKKNTKVPKLNSSDHAQNNGSPISLPHSEEHTNKDKESDDKEDLC